MEAVIFTGVQGSGKTTFYQQRFLNTHVRISMDLLKTRHRERMFLNACLSTGQRFVVDNTNPRAADRAEYILAARAAGFRVVSCYFETSLKAALARNARRGGRAVIPVPGVIGTFKRIEAPSSAEGFDELLVVSIGQNGDFHVENRSALQPDAPQDNTEPASEPAVKPTE
jgi:predicted ABC-type ATPase